ncbi:hypothetical protein [Pelomonas sp. SE-A7]|uniref:hypothetical protein n=1 Tax=Pelomonas sp. SE-A7 TaxID=3054953 RepID=UPI00259CBF2B|nr:hypothetical protein [Pelomonas sp. SE-A7]MDM4765053.1 hypothetical protein [Pelomonas sp. SE-A7]
MSPSFLKRYRVEALLGLALLVLWVAAWCWQNPGSALNRSEIERYMAESERIPFPPEERVELRKHLRGWLEADDGLPVYMLNLMRFYPELRRYEGSLAENQLSPQASNRHYEDVVIPMLLKVGGYPVYGGKAQGRNVLVHEPGLDEWNRALVVRYPSRRAFMTLITDPAYRAVAPYKLMSLTVVLTPTSFELAIPELSWMLGALSLIVWLFVAWRCAARRK